MKKSYGGGASPVIDVAEQDPRTTAENGVKETGQSASFFRRASLARDWTALEKTKKDFLATWILVMASSYFL